MTAGYSGKPLHQKLGLKPGQQICVINSPSDYQTLIDGPVSGLEIRSTPRGQIQFAHIFETEAIRLSARLPELMKAIAPDGMIWVSWPKKAAKVPTDITEDVVRELALPIGLVDVKVCAVNEVWSGLKLVIRRERR
jgi:hypothetical protein